MLQVDPGEADLCIAYGDGVSTALKLKERVLDRFGMSGKLVLKDKGTGIDVDLEADLMPALRDVDAVEAVASLFTTERTDLGDMKVHFMVIDQRQPSIVTSCDNDSLQNKEDKQSRRASGASSIGVAGVAGCVRPKKEKEPHADSVNGFLDKILQTTVPVEEFEVRPCMLCMVFPCNCHTALTMNSSNNPLPKVGTTVSNKKCNVRLEWEGGKWEPHDTNGKVLCRFVSSSKGSTEWAFAHSMTKAAVYVAKASTGTGEPSSKDIKDAMTTLHK